MTKWEKTRLAYADRAEARKARLFGRLGGGTHAEKAFWKECVSRGCAFDVEAGGEKLEVRPEREFSRDSWEAVPRKLESDWEVPSFDLGELVRRVY